MYCNIEKNKKINNTLEFRSEFPNTSFPKVLTDEIMEEYGYLKINIVEAIPSIYSNVINSEIEVIDGITTITQSLVYKSLYECKEIALSNIKTKREIDSSDAINNIQVATLQDRENIQGSIEYFTMLSQGKGTITWTMADNTEKELSLQELQDVLDYYVIRKAQVFAEYQNKKQLIDNCTTVEELEALNI